MASETIVAVFRTAAEAETVATELRGAGISPSAIQQHAQSYGQTGTDATLAQPASTTGEQRSGLWSWLLGEESYKDDHTAYDQSLSSGNVILSVIVADTQAAQAVSIIERHHPVDIDEKTTSGMTGSTAMAGATTATTTTTTQAATAQVPTATTAAAGGEVISLAEESLAVGKRQVAAGSARIRRYVVERPVEEQIRLRSESLRVDRRPVSGDARVAADAFTEKVIEVKETAEEAVVGKSARVVEEVVVGKDVKERVETVRDTVRREEIEVVEGVTPTTQTGTVQTGTTSTTSTTSPNLTPPSKTQAPSR